MRFFSKITFLCNLCFVVFVIMRILEKQNEVKSGSEAIIPLPVLQNSLVVLGMCAILLSFIFAISVMVYRLQKKPLTIATWLVWVNLLFLLLQVIYFNLY